MRTIRSTQNQNRNETEQLKFVEIHKIRAACMEKNLKIELEVVEGGVREADLCYLTR